MNPAIDFLSAVSDRRMLRMMLQFAALLLAAVLLSACGGGASTETNPAAGLTNNTGNLGISTYTGPSAQTDDIRAFQVNVWEQLRVPTKCGACHNPTVGQDPMFVREDDVNIAYGAANPLIDLDNPAASRLVTKVGEGHNCWLPSVAACATAITGYIQNWAAGTAGGGKQILLSAPTVIKDPGATITFPATAAETAFATTVYPLVRGVGQCIDCHIDSSGTKQQPYFASDDINEAYEAIKSKINLNDPASSRVVLRLRDEFHNCWTGAGQAECAADGATMQAAINAMLAGPPALVANTVSAPTVFSKALTLADGVVASGGNRYEKDIIALYEFKTGSGSIALDSSGVAPDLNLTLSPNPDTSPDISWVGGWGISITNGRAQGSTASSKKLRDLIVSTGEYSIEAWVAPANVTQEGPARIISYSAGTTARNFTLGQTQYNYDFMQRSSTTDANGEPMLSTADADEDLQASLQHVVVTYDPLNGRRIYVNGVFTDDMDPVPTGNLGDWDDTFAFVLGNEVSGDRQWKGVIRMVAIHNRSLTPEQIQQNFDVGVGEKFFLLFSIGDVAGVPADSYIMFSVEQYDSYSYLFDKPTYVNLDPAKTPGTIPLKNMSIGINGRPATIGQAYRNLDLDITDALYNPETGQVLSNIGTIIPLEAGPEIDEFFLTFEVLGGASNPVPPEVAMPTPDVPVPAQASDIGVRTFDEINATMAAITGVDETVVSTQFNTLRRQFPADEAMQSFLSSQQMAIAQLAIAYCSTLVDDAALRAGFFDFASTAAGDAFFNAPVVTAFNTAAGDSAEKNQIVTALYDRIAGIPPELGGADLVNAPTRAQVKAELIGPNPAANIPDPDNLFDRLAGSCATTGDAACQADRTRTVVKSMCASTLGSAAMLVQ